MSEPLGLHSVIGFGGQVDNGLIVHPDGKTLIYALGSTIVLRAKDDEKAQEFLQGHTDSVSCLKLSPSGRYLASGQLTYMGFTADVIIWDLESRSLLHRLQLQKVRGCEHSWMRLQVQCSWQWRQQQQQQQEAATTTPPQHGLPNNRPPMWRYSHASPHVLG
jgi:WD40 repeat protein